MECRPPDGGWEACLTDQHDDEHICPICYDVMVAPTSSGCPAAHTTCLECIDEHLLSPSGSKCPAGCGFRIKREGIVRMTDKQAQIDALRARCKHADGVDPAGASTRCDWTGPFGELKAHLGSTCPFEPVACPWASIGCTEVVLRRDLEEHLKRNTVQHMQLAGGKIAALSSTVANLSSSVVQLETRMQLARMQLTNSVPRLIELEDVSEVSESGGVLPAEAQTFLGLYQLDEDSLVNEFPLWQHCEFPDRCIAYSAELSRWHAQLRAGAGEARGYMYCTARRGGRPAVAPSPHACEAPWFAYTRNAETGEHKWEQDLVRCVLWEEQPQLPQTRTFARVLELHGTLPRGVNKGSLDRYLGTFRLCGREMHNGRHTCARSLSAPPPALPAPRLHSLHPPLLSPSLATSNPHAHSTRAHRRKASCADTHRLHIMRVLSVRVQTSSRTTTASCSGLRAGRAKAHPSTLAGT